MYNYFTRNFNLPRVGYRLLDTGYRKNTGYRVYDKE